jgi:hypothetical protein
MGKRLRMMDWRLLTATDRAFLHFKVALAVMLWSPMWQSPSMASTVTGALLMTWIAVTVIGFCVSVYGLLQSAQSVEQRVRGLRTELVGLYLLSAGPLVFLAVQTGLWLTGGRVSGLAFMFPYVVLAAIFARITMVKAAQHTFVFKLPANIRVADSD